MKLKKSYILFGILFAIVVIGTCIFYYQKDKVEYSTDFNEYLELKDKHGEEFDYHNIWDTSESHYTIEDDEIMVKIKFKNITPETQKVRMQIYYQPELVDNYVSALPYITIMPDEDIILDSGKSYISRYSTMIIKCDGDEDLAKIKELMSSVHVEMYMEGKYAYFELPIQEVNE